MALAATPPDRLPRYFPIGGASLPGDCLTLPWEVKARANKNKKNTFCSHPPPFRTLVSLSPKYVRDYSFFVMWKYH